MPDDIPPSFWPLRPSQEHLLALLVAAYPGKVRFSRLRRLLWPDRSREPDLPFVRVMRTVSALWETLGLGVVQVDMVDGTTYLWLAPGTVETAREFFAFDADEDKGETPDE
jgi:hypothetical protein